jgi:DNA-binding NarL/FixJ family response regulator
MPTTILLADDHLLFRQGLAALLHEPGSEWQIVGEASDGAEAIRLAESLRPDVVVLDVEMPGVTGIEAAARIRQLSPESRLIAVSMYGDEYYRQRMFEAGVSAYLLKSEAIDSLLEALRACRRGERIPGRPTVPARARRDGERTDPRSAGIDKQQLTPRELEVLRLLAQGQRNKEIAAALGISVKTVETYRHRIGLKLGIDSLQGLVLFALRAGLIPSAPSL